jgi:hypothetical protein
MAGDFADLKRKLDGVGNALTGAAVRQITTNVAVKSKAAATSAISPKTLSHYGRKSVTVKARFDVKSDHEAELKPTPAGLAALLEKGSGTTWKAPKRRGSARRKRGTVGSYQRGKVPARQAWTKGVSAFAPKVSGWVHDEVARALGSVF